MPGGVVAGTHREKFAAQFIINVKAIFGTQFSFEKTAYVNTSTKVTITCKDHGDFEIKPNNLLHSPFGCVKCSKGKIQDNPTCAASFEYRAQKIHGDTYDYSKVVFVNVNVAVTILCSIHGPFTQTPRLHLRHAGCKKCNLAKGNLRYTTETYIAAAKKIHETRGYDYSKTVFTSGHEAIIVICPSHGDYSVEASDHLTGRECYKCSLITRTKTTEDFIKGAQTVHGDVYDYAKTAYVRCDKDVIITCKKHGDFLQRPNGHLSGSGCSRCFKGSSSKKAIQWLEYMMVRTGEYIQHAENEGEWCFPDASYTGNATRRADGFSASSDTVFEFAGTHFHGDPRMCDPDKKHFWIDKTYGDLYQQTMEREEWIKSLGYKLVTIWELDWNRAVKAVKKIQRAFRNRRKFRRALATT